jgi:hypothetical protein
MNAALDLARMAVANLSRRDRALLVAELVPTTAAQAAPDVLVVKRAKAALLLGVSTRTVSALAASGALPPVRLPGRTRAVGFRLAYIESLAEGRGTP